jgi:hypothetical protein
MTLEHILASLRELATGTGRRAQEARETLERIEAKASLEERMGVSGPFAAATRPLVEHRKHESVFRTMTAEQAREHLKRTGRK